MASVVGHAGVLCAAGLATRATPYPLQRARHVEVSLVEPRPAAALAVSSEDPPAEPKAAKPRPVRPRTEAAQRPKPQAELPHLESAIVAQPQPAEAQTEQPQTRTLQSDRGASASSGSDTPRTAGSVTTGPAPTPGPGGTGTSAKPRYRSNPPPDYPLAARRRHDEGIAYIAVDVSATGTPTHVALQRSSGSELLDAAALTAVRGWTFEPGVRDGVATASSVVIPVNFHLHD